MGAYFQTLTMLMWAMTFITVVALPMMVIFATGEGVKYDYMGIITQFSLGNLGIFYI